MHSVHAPVPPLVPPPLLSPVRGQHWWACGCRWSLHFLKFNVHGITGLCFWGLAFSFSRHDHVFIELFLLGLSHSSYECSSLRVCLPVPGHWGCFHLLSVTNKVIQTLCPTHVWRNTHFSWVNSQERNGWVTGSCTFNLKETDRMIVPLYIPAHSVCSHPHQHLACPPS